MKRTAIKPKPPRRNESEETRRIVSERYWCERCKAKGILRQGTERHHIQPKGMGGTRREYFPEDIEWLCSECHRNGANAVHRGATVE